MNDFGCWRCGHDTGRVLSVGRDEDGNKIRLRACEKCGARWVTEERRLDKSVTFSQRAFSAAEHQRKRRAKVTHTCRFCGSRYRLGAWRNHLTYSPIHRAWKQKREQEIRQYKTDDARWRYHADPVYRANQIAQATQRSRRRRAA